MKIIFFVVVIVAAVLFDLSHEKDATSEKPATHNTRGSQSHELSRFCFLNLFNTLKQKTISDKSSARRLFFVSESEFIQKYHYLKTCRLAKVGAANKYKATEQKNLFVCQGKCLYRDPDDDFPLV